MTYPNQSRAGNGLAIILIGLMLCYAAWTALHRTVHVDDASNEARAHARASWPDMRIDLNSASAAELALLPGLGPALAERIVADREARGLFTTVDELDRVMGIGKAILERVRPHVVVEIPQKK